MKLRSRGGDARCNIPEDDPMAVFTDLAATADGADAERR
jgi:hypothetical protein